MMIFTRTVKVLTILLFLLGGLYSGAGEIRVVSLSPSLTELVFQLGKGSLLVGRSTVCDHPAEVAELPVVGNFADPDLERVLKCKPTLVITNDLRHPGAEKALARAGIRLVRRQCRNLEEYIGWTGELGKLLNCPGAAEKEIARVRGQLELFRKQAEALPRKKKICWVIWDSPLLIAGGSSLPETVIGYAGGINIAQGLRPEYIKASKDWLLKNQPEVLIWTCPRPLDRNDRFWKSLTAVRTDQVIFLPDSSLLLRPGPRLPDGIRLLKRELEKLP